MRVLVDANVLLDVLAERQPFFTPSAAVWALVEQGRADAVVSAVSVTNIYYIGRRAFGRERALAAVRAVAKDFAIAAVDQDVVNEAIASGLPDFEDAIQAFAGRRAAATHVITRDPQGFAGGPLSVMTPNEFISTFSMDSGV